MCEVFEHVQVRHFSQQTRARVNLKATHGAARRRRRCGHSHSCIFRRRFPQYSHSPFPSHSSCTFDIIPLPSHQNTNKSPIVHEQHHLGLESWCVQHVYEYAHNTILAGTRPPSLRAQRPQSPTKPAAQSTDQMLKYLNSATLINPDVATYWNIRRKLFVRNRLNIGREFQFTAIVLSKKPKSNEAFFYRRWLFSFQSEWRRC